MTDFTGAGGIAAGRPEDAEWPPAFSRTGAAGAATHPRAAWRSEGLRLANDMRREHLTVTQAEIARAISFDVPGAPRNLENIRRWLTHREESGDLLARGQGAPGRMAREESR